LAVEALVWQQAAFWAQHDLTLVLTAPAPLQHSGPPLGQSVQQSAVRQHSPPGTQPGFAQQGSATQQAPLGQQSPVGQQAAWRLWFMPLAAKPTAPKTIAPTTKDQKLLNM